MSKYNFYVPLVHKSRVAKCRIVDEDCEYKRMVKIEFCPSDDIHSLLPVRADKRILCDNFKEAEKALFVMSLGGKYNGVRGHR